MTGGGDICRHEAAHAAMGMFWDVPIRSISVADGGGVCEYSPVFSHDREGAVKRMMCILAGPIESDAAPSWPVRLDGGPAEFRDDRRVLSEIIRAHDITEGEYEDIVGAAVKAASTPTYQRTLTAVAAGLAETPVLDGEHLLAVQRIGRGKTSRGAPFVGSRIEHKTFATIWLTPSPEKKSTAQRRPTADDIARLYRSRWDLVNECIRGR